MTIVIMHMNDTTALELYLQMLLSNDVQTIMTGNI
jgi:hypothetical protein